MKCYQIIITLIIFGVFVGVSILLAGSSRTILVNENGEYEFDKPVVFKHPVKSECCVTSLGGYKSRDENLGKTVHVNIPTVGGGIVTLVFEDGLLVDTQ